MASEASAGLLGRLLRGGASSGGSLSLYASSSETNLDCAPTSSAAALVISDFIRPAIFDSMTSRDSSEASAFASSAERTLPSMYHP